MGASINHVDNKGGPEKTISVHKGGGVLEVLLKCCTVPYSWFMDNPQNGIEIKNDIN